MNPEKYIGLKSKSKIVVKKSAAVAEIKDSDGNVTSPSQKEYFYAETKSYDGETGEELDSLKKRISLSGFEREKEEALILKTQTEAKIAGLEAIITDIKAL